MDKLRTVLEQVSDEIRNDLVDGVTLLGGNLSIIEHSLAKNKYVSKKAMRKALAEQKRYLHMIDDSRKRALALIDEQLRTPSTK